MELEEIVLVLRNCFEESQIRNLIPDQNIGQNPYYRAAELVLEGEESGDGVSSRLDADSAAQREKIRQLSLTDLRKSLVIEFLEPGRNLGLIVWALLRDGRVGAAHLASQIYKTFESKEMSATPGVSFKTPFAQETTGDLDIEEIDIDELQDLDKIINAGEEPDINQIAEEDERTVLEEIDLHDKEFEILDEVLEEFPDSEIDKSQEESEEEIVLDDLENVLNSVVDDDRDIDLGSFDENDLELEEGKTTSLEDIVIPDVDELSEFIDENIFDDEIAMEEDLSDTDELSSILDETLAVNTDEDDIADFDDLDEILEEEGDDQIFEPGAELPPAVDIEEEEIEIEELDIPDLDEIEEPSPAPKRQYITMAGIDVPLESLHKACCGVFGEPIELVTDEELLSQDKIGVVGKKCGVKILHGPKLEY